MRAGRKRHRLQFIELVESGSDYGAGGEITREQYKEVWGSLEALRGREYWDSRQTQSEATHIIRTRYIPAGNKNLAELEIELKGTGRVFEIEHFNDVDGKQKEHEFLVKERLTPAEEE